MPLSPPDPLRVELAHARHKVEEALQTPASSVKPVISEAERSLVRGRDWMILHLRAHPAAPERPTLRQINAILSLVYGAHNPVGGIQWEYLKEARAALDQLLPDEAI